MCLVAKGEEGSECWNGGVNGGWQRYERRISSSDNFAEFEELFSGNVTPHLAAKMPSSILLEKRDQVGPDARNIIDREINRRLMLGNLLSVISFPSSPSSCP